MENKVLKLGGGRSTQDVYAEIRQGSSERWTIQSQKSKYVNGKLSGVIGVGYTASINNSDYLLEEDKSNNEIQITSRNDGITGLCVLTQEESGNKINLHLTTPSELIVNNLDFSVRQGGTTNSWVIQFVPNYPVASNITIRFNLMSNPSRQYSCSIDVGSIESTSVYVNETEIPSLNTGSVTPSQDSKYIYQLN